MKKNILITLLTGLTCGIIGFKSGRAGTLPEANFTTYQLGVRKGVRDYKLHYFATREQVAELLQSIDDWEQRFYREIPDAHKTGSEPPQHVIDLFGNLDKWEKNYRSKTKRWDAQVEQIEASIEATEP